MNTHRRLLTISAFLFLALLVVGGVFLWAKKGTTPAPNDNRLVILTTIFPLEELAAAVGGEQALVSSLLPAGVDVHHFEPRPSDLIKLQGADLFIYGGEVLEPGMAKMLNSLEVSDLEILDASQVSNLIASTHDEEADDHDHSESIDPHFWLDFENDEKIVVAISEKLSILDSANTFIYQARADDYQKKLQNLNIAYESGLKNCASREIIYGGHYTFAYLAERYDLDYLAAQGVSPDAEPGAQTLIDLSKQAGNQADPYVFYEAQESSKVAATIAAESGAKLLPLSSGHILSPAQKEAGLTFIEIMENNLTNLRQGLNCQ
jgi:zinc transport system substrate-binding protein